MDRIATTALIALLLALLAGLPAAHPEARLFSDGWGATRWVDPALCLTPGDGGTTSAPTASFDKPPAPATPSDRLTLALRYLAAGLLLPLLALAGVLHPRSPARHPAWLAFGLLGFAPAWFQWPLNPAFVALRQWLADAWLARWPLAEAQLAWLDGTAVSLWLGGGTLLGGGAILALTRLAAHLAEIDWRDLARTLIPLAAVLALLGLTQSTALYLRGEGLTLDWLPGLRVALLALAVGESLRQGCLVIARVGARNTVRRIAAGVIWLLPSTLFALHGWAMYFHWTDRYHV